MRKKIEIFLQKIRTFFVNLKTLLGFLKLKAKSLWDHRFLIISKLKTLKGVNIVNFFRDSLAKVKKSNQAGEEGKNTGKGLENLLQFLERVKILGPKLSIFFKGVLSKTSWGRGVLKYLNDNSPLDIFFLPEKRGVVHKSFSVILTFSLAYIIGKNLALILSPSDDGSNVTAPVVVVGKELRKKDYNQISVNNIFQTKDLEIKESEGPKKVNKNVVCYDAKVESKLGLKLINTIVLQNHLKSLASIDIGKGKTESFRVGNKIRQEARIDRIGRLRVFFKNLKNNQCEYLAAKDAFETRKNASIVSPEAGKKLIKNKKMKGIENNGNKFVISKAVMNKKMEDIDKILTQARGVQVNNPDGSLSFIITEIEPGSVYSFLGIENNDRITRINGKKIKGLNEVMNLFAGIQQIDHLELTVIKEDGNERNLEYSFSK